MSQARHGFSQLELADRPSPVAWARRHTVDVLGRWQVPPDVIETARLLVSELATNAVRHSKSDTVGSLFSEACPVQTITLALMLGRGRLLLSVRDSDCRPPVVKSVGEDAESGRGIFLVEALSEHWGYYHLPAAAGKVVWSELTLVAPDLRIGAEHPPNPSDPPASCQVVEDPRRGQAPPLLMARTLVGLREL
ncbi:ATP-binding protein [Streptomyces sp. XY431]|uniref:ATP-binding protein n=1 Tax=Streptomyces sp. XY431 TaxID=1415562 RepID=UPI0007C63F4B|nr:ATP-binding protein [Streptomyces sp. XY431]